MPRHALVAALLATSLIASSVASIASGQPSAPPAQPSVKDLARAKDLFSKGRADELAAHYAQGLAKFEEVEKIKAGSATVFHIAFCKEKLGRLLEASEDYDRASTMAKAEVKPEVLKQIQARSGPLQERLPKLSVLVPAGIPDVKVTLDDRLLPEKEWGVAKRVSPGAHKVEATAPDVPPFRANVDSPERSTQEIKVVLATREPAHVVVAPVPVPGSPAHAPATSRAPDPGPAAPGADTSNIPPPPDGDTPKHASYTGAIVATVGAGALAGLGVASFLVAGGKQDTLTTQCPTLSVPACDGLRSPVRTWDTLALVGFGAAGVSLVAAVVLFATASPSHKRASTASTASTGSRAGSGSGSFFETFALAPAVAVGPSGGQIGVHGVLP